MEDFVKVLSYTNRDSASLSWQDASQLVVDGDAAFNVMGDWAEGYFKELGKEPKTDFGWAPVPGSVVSFQFLSDSFVLPKGAPHRDAAIAWLTVVVPKKGRMPSTRSRVRSRLAVMATMPFTMSICNLQWMIGHKDVVVGSFTHGVVANDSWKSEIDTALVCSCWITLIPSRRAGRLLV